MLKKDLKSKKSEKKNILKRREGNSKFRSINNYQIIDKVPNDNLYKNDNLYSINKNFEFPLNEEESFRLFCHYYFQKNGIKSILLLIYLRLLSSRMNNIKDIFSPFTIINLKNIFHLISLVISFIFTKEEFIRKEIFNIYIYYIFSFNQSIHAYSIYSNTIRDFQKYLTIPSELLFNLLLLFFLDTKIKHTIFPIITNCIIFLFSAKISPSLNLLFYFSFGIAFSILLYMLMIKSIREIWALYDSFKRSYYNMNQGLLDSDPNPIFILSKDKRVLYKNTAATKLIDNILENKNVQKKMKKSKEDNFINVNFIDIIHPNLRDLFTKLLNDAMEDDTVSSFNFPLCKKNEQNDLNLDVSSAYDINDKKNYLYFIWYSILVCKTEWKNKSAFYMCLFTSDDVLLNEIFYQYTKRFSEKIESVISSSDIITSAFMNKKLKSEISSSTINSVKKSENSELEEEGKEKKNDFDNQKKNIYKLLIENADNIELNNTILYFFKNQVELLYDYSLTLELYFTMLYNQRNFKFNFQNKNQNSKKRIKLNDLKAYYSEYFYDFTKEHNYKLEFKNDDNKDVYFILIEENYLRILLFNVIVFMICYLDDKTEKNLNDRKEIIIKLIPEIKEDISTTPIISPESNKSNKGNEDQVKFTPKSSDTSDKNIKKGELSFIFESFSPNINLNKIQEILNQKNKNNCQIKEEIIKLNYLDIGILTVKYLLQNYYKTNINLFSKEGEQFIEFVLPCELELVGASNNSKKNDDIEANSFFTSPLLHPRKNINKPKNFYNYNENYNKKVLNIFYGIEKSPDIISRHRRGIPSFSVLNEEKNRQRRYLRHLSQNAQQFSNKEVTTYSTEQNKYFYLNDNNKILNNKESDKSLDNNNHKNSINRFSFKQMDISIESASFRSDRIEEEDNDNILNEKILETLENEKIENKSYALIFENPNNKDFISFLNNENKGEYTLKIIKEVNEAENELNNKDEKSFYKIILINMGNIKEIKLAEKFCENKGETLIFGYHFGAHTKSKEKNNVKYDKRFDLSFSYEGILYALNKAFISNSSIIK